MSFAHLLIPRNFPAEDRSDIEHEVLLFGTVREGRVGGHRDGHTAVKVGGLSEAAHGRAASGQRWLDSAQQDATQ